MKMHSYSYQRDRDSHKLVSDMKIRQKLTIGFVGTSLLVGSIGCLALIVDKHTHAHIDRINKKYIYEFEFSGQAIADLQAVNVATHKLSIGEIHIYSRGEVVALIESKLSKIENIIDDRINRNDPPLIAGFETDITRKESEESYQSLKALKANFLRYKTLVAQYLQLLSTNEWDAKQLLANKLEWYVEKSLLPAIKAYKQRAGNNLLTEARETEKMFLMGERAIVSSTLAAVITAIVVGYFISRSILKPIDKLKAAAIQVGEGHLETRVAIDSHDELGVLADAFNQMILGLSRTTVSQIYLDKILSSMSDLLIVTNPERIVTKVNQATLDLLGFSKSELLGKSIDIFLSQNTNLSVYTLADRGLNLNLETNLLTAEGRTIPVSLSSSAIVDEQGNKQGFVCVARDITEKKRIEAAMLQVRVAEAARAETDRALQQEKHLNEMKSKFISIASHEFRTPLTTILSSTELVRDYGYKWTEERKNQHFQRIATSVKHMTGLLNDVLLIGKAEARKIEFNPHSIDVVSFCQELIEEIEITAKNHKVLFHCKRQYIHACMDEKLLRHIFTNLLSNAIKYSPKGGTVNFKLIFQLEHLIFQVQDQGIGIPQTELSQLFETFHRASNVGTIPGTGLGLAIVKKSVEAHQGTITVASEIGIGTTFQVTLPLYEVYPVRDSYQ
ncbi:sensor histidine kinase [Chroococcidiopsis sp. SAG 2025]|uniref:sensor histidine kinase n=1 Tax=Chroococcidiopsis sp. SAG 2025 TaxID=171389 RepID=UPI0029373AFD|nr:ATP-binding protein [Chroococcidiopsis sp. SAG 2025]